MAAILTVGLQTIRDLLKTGLSPIVAVSDDTTAFAAGQTTVNPGGGSTVVLAKTASIANVSGTNAYDATITVAFASDTTFQNKAIQTIAACTGTTAAPVAQSRSVRAAGLGIGVVAGDTHTLGLRVTPSDQSP